MRKPAAATLRIVEGRGHGTDSGGRKVTLPPAFRRLAPDPPEWLPAEARAEWDRIIPELQRLQLIKPLDRAALTAYCLTWDRLVSAQREVEANGSVLGRNAQGLVRHPAVAVVEAASKELRSWTSEFGLTPSAEARISRPEADDGIGNPFASG